MEGAVAAIVVSIVLSVAGLMGVICSVGFQLIEAIKSLKEKTQSEDCKKADTKNK